MIGKFPEILNFNRLCLELNRLMRRFFPDIDLCYSDL